MYLRFQPHTQDNSQSTVTGHYSVGQLNPEYFIGQGIGCQRKSETSIKTFYLTFCSQIVKYSFRLMLWDIFFSKARQYIDDGNQSMNKSFLSLY